MFSCEFYEIFKNIFFTEHLCWLLLQINLVWKNCVDFYKQVFLLMSVFFEQNYWVRLNKLFSTMKF